MRRDKELVQIFVRGYNELLGATYVIREWPDEVDRRNPSVEAIAQDLDGRLLAIEHTLIQPYMGEKDDTQAFRDVFMPLESEPRFRLPGYDIEVWVPVGAIPKGVNWRTIGQLVADWFANQASGFPEGVSMQKIEGLPFDLSVRVEKEPFPDGRVFVGRSSMPETLQDVIVKALSTKVPKLLCAHAGQRTLLFEKDSLPRGYVEIGALVDDLRGNFPEMARIDEIWVVNTVDWSSKGTLWFLRVWPGGVRAKFTIRETVGAPEDAIVVRSWTSDDLARKPAKRK